MEQQNKFEGWAVIEIMGHNKEAGFVTTEYFGGPALFRVDVPELPAQDITTKRPYYNDGRLIPAGAKVRKEPVPGRTAFVGPAAVFRMNPCTEEVARRVLEDMAPRPIAIVEMPPERSLQTALPGEPEYEEEDDRSEMEPTEEELEEEGI